MPYRVVLYSPDRGIVYDGRTPEETGVGGGITARVSLLHALAALGHDVTAYVNCRARVTYRGVAYAPLDDVRDVDADIFIAMTTGGALSFAPLQSIPRRARLSIVWVQGVPQPAGLDIVHADRFYVASNFLRDVCTHRWGVPAERVFVCYNGLDQDVYAALDASPPGRDPHAIAFVGPPSKGLSEAVAVLRRLRDVDDRFHLHVFGGRALWGDSNSRDDLPEPGVIVHGLLNQRELAARLASCEYALALQDVEEGFGIAVQEAKRAGAVVIASRAGALQETIRSSYDGFLVETPAGDPELVDRVARMVLDLAVDPARRQRIRSYAAQTPWSWTLAARTWTAHWDHLLGAAAAPAVTLDNGETAIALPDGFHVERTGEYRPLVYPATLARRIGNGAPAGRVTARPRRVLIGGYFGHGNLGDEAILQATVQGLRAREPDIAISVATGNPRDTSRRHDVDAIDERDPLALLAASRQADLVVLGGGGLFHDTFGLDGATLLSRLHWGLTHCASFAAAASLAGKPFAIHAAGVGPLDSPEGVHWTRLVFERAASATVRDAHSLDLLHRIGAETWHVRIAADPAFALTSPSSERVEAIRRRVARSASPCVAVAVREWGAAEDSGTWQAELAAALDLFVEAHGGSVLFVPFQRALHESAPDDVRAAEAVRDGMQQAQAAAIAPADLSVDDVQALLQTCDLVLAMRLHAMILAANAGVPVVAISYDAKVRATAAALGLEEHVFELRAVSADALAAKLTETWLRRDAQVGVLQQKRAEQAAAAGASIDALLGLLTCPAEVAPVSGDWQRELQGVLTRELTRAERATQELESASEALAETRAALVNTTAALAELDDARLAAASSETAASAPATSSEVLRLAEQVRAREDELAVIRHSRAWRAITAYREARRTASAWMRRPFAVTGQIARASARRLVPAPVRQQVRRTVSRWWMNPYAYVFDRFKRARMQRYGASADGIRAPGEASLVSVVLPVYNGASMIAGAIDSVLAQTYRRFELIVVDDGSTDETPRILEDYAARDERIRIIRQPNAKLPRALSAGFKQARGEFLTWTSADNRLKPPCFEKLVGCLQRHPGWDMAYANVDIIAEDGAYLRGSPHYEGYQRPHGSEHVHLPEVTDELNVWPNNYVGAAFMYRSRVPFLIGDYSPRRFVLEDYDYWMRVNALLTLRHADFTEPVYDYRFHGASLTSRWEDYDMLGHRERMMVFEEFRRDFYLAPMFWVIDGPARSLVDRVRGMASRAGHHVYSGDIALDRLPRLWVPTVHVWCVDRATAETVAPELPCAAFRVLLAADGHVPADIDARWHLAITMADVTPPRTSRPWRGWLSVRDDGALLQAIDARAKSEHLAAIEALVEQPPAATLKATVIICTHRGDAAVARSVRAALDQTFPADRYEVLVVDNAPSRRGLDASALEALGADRGGAGHLRVVACPISGLSAARNAGLAEARGEVVAFLDDDAVPAGDWLARLCGAFDAHPGTAVIGGHIHLEVPAPRPDAAVAGWEKYWSQFVTPHTTFTEVRHWWEFPWGANWAVRRDALRRAGGFRLNYGRTGDDYWGGEEIVAAALIQRLGGGVAILPTATVTHAVDPSRFSFDHVRQTIRAGQLASYLAQRDLYIPSEASLGRTVALLATRHGERDLSPAHRRHDFRYRKRAQLALLLQQVRDLQARRRRPVVAEEPPRST